MPKIKKIRTAPRNKRYDKKSTQKQHTVSILTESQIQVIDTIKNSRDKAICQILLYTGMRISELAYLNYGECFNNIKKKDVKDKILVTGKRNKSRELPTNTVIKNAILAIHEYNKKSLYVVGINKNTPLLISQKGSRLHTNTIREMINNQLGTNPHTLRHTCFTLLRKHGVQGEVIQELAGHESYSTTRKYYISVSESDKAAAIALFDNLYNSDKIQQFKLIKGA